MMRAIPSHALNPQLFSKADPTIPQMSLSELLQQKRFDELLEILTDDSIDFRSWFRQSSKNQRGQTVLHIVLQHDPPIAIVRLTLRRARQVSRTTDPILAQDKGGMTPLHVAVARSSHFKVVELFLCGTSAIHNHNPATLLDCQDRFPLHWACANLATMSNLSNKSEAVENIVRVIGCLVAACPIAVDSPDAIGLTPRGMALSARKVLKTDKRIFHRLDSAAKLNQKQQKKQQDLEQQQQDLEQQQLLVPREKEVTVDRAAKNVMRVLEKAIQYEVGNCGVSQRTLSTAASSTNQRPVDVLECDYDDIDLSSMGWAEDEEYVFQKRIQRSKRKLRLCKLVRSDSVRLDL